MGIATQTPWVFQFGQTQAPEPAALEPADYVEGVDASAVDIFLLNPKPVSSTLVPLFANGFGPRKLGPTSRQTRSPATSPKPLLKDEVASFLEHLLQSASLTDVEPLQEIWEAAEAQSLAQLWNSLNRLSKTGILLPGRDRHTNVLYWQTLQREVRFMALRARVASEILSIAERERLDIPTADKTALTQAVQQYEDYRKTKRREEQAGQSKKAAERDTKLALAKRLSGLGVLVRGDSVSSLDRLLQSAEKEPSEEKEKLIADFLSAMGWYEPWGPVLQKHQRHNSGKKIELPQAFQFFDRHYRKMGYYRDALEPMGVLHLLKTLVYPDSIRMAAFYEKIGLAHGASPRGNIPDDPVELEGYAEAVRELMAKVRALRRADILSDEDLEPLPLSDPKEPIPVSKLTPALKREYARLFEQENFRKRVEAAIYGYRYHDRLQHSPAEDSPPIEGGYKATFNMLYAKQTRGEQPTDLKMKKVDLKKGEPEVLGGRQSRREQWLFSLGGVGDPVDIRKGGRNKLDEYGNLGRFYFAIRWEYRKPFWKKLTDLMAKASKAHVAFQAKISLNQFHVDTGDNAVLYFRSGNEQNSFDQELMYNLVCAMMVRCPKEWFHDEASRPILAAQVLDPDGKKIVGLSFMQDPIEDHSSGNGIRAEVHALGIRNARLLRILGAPVDEATEKILMAIALLKQGRIDLEHPAFNLASTEQPIAGKDLFAFIRSHTDQAGK